MYPLLALLVVCAVFVVLYPPAALAIFALGAIVTGWAAFRKARARGARDPGTGGTAGKADADETA
jgi:amino acid permease